MSLPMAHISFTFNDEKDGYKKTLEHLRNCDTKCLKTEYTKNMRGCFDKLFGHNARRFQNLIATVLIGRGETHIDNIFGPIEIKKWSY